MNTFQESEERLASQAEQLHAEALAAIGDLQRLARKLRREAFIEANTPLIIIGVVVIGALAGYVTFAVIAAWLIVR